MIDPTQSEFKAVRVWARSREVFPDIHYSICSDSHSPNLRATMQRHAVLRMRRTAAGACTCPRRMHRPAAGTCSQTCHMDENLSSSLRLYLSLTNSGKSSVDSVDHPRVNFSRQPLRTFRYFSDFSRDAMNWTSSCPCDKFMSKCAPPAGACATGQCMHRQRFCAYAVQRGSAWRSGGLVNANLSKYYNVNLEKHHGSYPQL